MPGSSAPLAARLERVDSPRDPRVADYMELRDADRARKRGVFIAEGIEVVRVMLSRGRYAPRSVLLAERHLARLAEVLEASSVPVYVAPDDVLSEIAGFDLHRGCLAAGALGALPPAEALLDAPRARPSDLDLVFVLEGIANHDNVGALFRNAAAFGARALFLDPGCADPLYRKAIRVSMGHALTIPWTRLEGWPGALALFAARGFEVWALTPGEGSEDLAALVRSGPGGAPAQIALLLGTEGTGLSKGALASATRRVRIPMAPDVDSLNVATAAAIAAFAVRAW